MSSFINFVACFLYFSSSESSDDSDPESPGGGELSDRQVYAIFRDSLFCFEEAKKVRIIILHFDNDDFISN